MFKVPPIIVNPYPKSNVNKWEREYSAHLRLLQLAGEIKGWEHEPDAIVLGYRCVYIPDFRVHMRHGGVEYHEVKGHMQDDAAVKLAVAAMLHPNIPFMVISRKGRSWNLRQQDSNPTLKKDR